jgi:indole-3-glycerol phosphate synthase
MAQDLLKEIVRKKKERLQSVKQGLTEKDLKERMANLGPTRPFLESINKNKSISLIAEVKKKSPSGGVLREDFDAVGISRIYKQAGAAAVSVITEEDFFAGDISYLRQIRQSIDLPLLRKDFIFEDYQIYESRFFGADALLLIADILTQEKIKDLINLAHSLDMDCLVEVHTQKDLKKVLRLKEVELIGLNNRDLHTLEVDMSTTQRLFPLIPKDKIVVVESGISSYQEVLFLKILGARAVLIGEAFMRADNIQDKIQQLMGKKGQARSTLA